MYIPKPFVLNKLIQDTTLNVEKARPISADVLVKDTIPVPVDLIMNIVVSQDYSTSISTVRENVRDAITNALNANTLGTTIDSSDLVYVAQGVAGVDRVRVLYFNNADQQGSVISISANKNEYIVANEVTINTEER